jgi:hypothetical protein
MTDKVAAVAYKKVVRSEILAHKARRASAPHSTLLAETHLQEVKSEISTSDASTVPPTLAQIKHEHSD